MPASSTSAKESKRKRQRPRVREDDAEAGDDPGRATHAAATPAASAAAAAPPERDAAAAAASDDGDGSDGDGDGDGDGTITGTAFSSFPIHPSLLRSIESLKWTHATNIQARSIPAALEGRDIVGLAEVRDRCGRTRVASGSSSCVVLLWSRTAWQGVAGSAPPLFRFGTGLGSVVDGPPFVGVEFLT